MANPNKRRGDRAELEVQGLLRDHLGVPARRALGAGRKDDVGDITGVPNTTVQVANWQNVAAAVRQKPVECEQQRDRAGADFAATFLRLPGGDYRVVLTPEQFFALWREATACESTEILSQMHRRWGPFVAEITIEPDPGLRDGLNFNVALSTVADEPIGLCSYNASTLEKALREAFKHLTEPA